MHAKVLHYAFFRTAAIPLLYCRSLVGRRGGLARLEGLEVVVARGHVAVGGLEAAGEVCLSALVRRPRSTLLTLSLDVARSAVHGLLLLLGVLSRRGRGSLGGAGRAEEHAGDAVADDGTGDGTTHGRGGLGHEAGLLLGDSGGDGLSSGVVLGRSWGVLLGVRGGVGLARARGRRVRGRGTDGSTRLVCQLAAQREELGVTH